MPETTIPFAVQRRLPEAQPTIRVRGVVLHSTGSANSPYEYFRTSSNLESTLGLLTDGTLEQYMGANERSDANYLANDYYASIETVGNPAYVSRQAWDEDPWTPNQIARIVQTLDWYAKEYDIPRQLMSSWDGYGFGYHIQYPQWHMVAKACPGARRIQQFKQLVLPALRGDYNGGVPVTDADILKVAAALDKVQKDDHAETRRFLKAAITNAANRVVRDLGGTPSKDNVPA